MEYLAGRGRERFLAAIARAARTPGENAVAIAEEGLSLDNEPLEKAEAAVELQRR